MADADNQMPEAGKTKRRIPRWITIALVLSLGANILIVGMMAGAAFHGPGPDRRAFGGPNDFGNLARALPNHHQDALREHLRERREDLRAERAEMRGLLGQLQNALTAEPFDIDAVRALMQQQRQIMNRGAIAAQQALLARIEAMTDDERAEFAEHLGKQGRR